MRIKISFVRDNMSGNSIPLHHQKIVSDTLGALLIGLGGDKSNFSFSSLKGTSKISNGFMRFLSSKLTLVISSRDKELVERMTKAVFERPHLQIGRMNLIPKSYEVIPDPEFQTKMRYLCIAPLALFDPSKEPEKAMELIDPTTQQFSDILYNDILDRMEAAGFSESKLSEFAEFDATPDQEYVKKIVEANKKFARYYKGSKNLPMMGYLLPFSLHAHPEVQQFIWELGIGALTEEGYGMIDVVK